MDVNIMGFDKVKYDNAFKKERYDSVVFEIAKGKRDSLKEYAASQGISVNQLIKYAVEKHTKINLHSPVEQDNDN
jgi:hypothetical protein